jgi:hypothetical protein
LLFIAISFETTLEDFHVEIAETWEIASFHHDLDQLENAIAVLFDEQESFYH